MNQTGLATAQAKALNVLHSTVCFHVSKVAAALMEPGSPGVSHEQRLALHRQLQEVLAVFGHMRDAVESGYTTTWAEYFRSLFTECESLNAALRAAGLRKALITYDGFKKMFFGDEGWLVASFEHPAAPQVAHPG